MGKHPCEGCVDWVPRSSTGGFAYAGGCCDYIGHTGHARSLICPPGEKCTVKSTTPRNTRVERYDRGGYPIRQPGKLGPPERIPVNKVRELAGKGLSNAKIAKEIGFSKSAVRACIMRYNIVKGVEALP